MEHEKIAVLITCHNRKTTTLTCLERLRLQDNIDYDVYLVDDGSTDGTSDQVLEHYPEVKIIYGDGNLFWVGGMRLAFAEAMKKGYPYYLWLNDDTSLKPTAISGLIDIQHKLVEDGYPDSIVVGSTQDAKTNQPTYGGAVKSQRWYSNKFEFLEPSQELQECDTMYGNCVLIAHSVVEKVGNIDNAFIHTFGDIDYGLRASKLGCSVWVAGGFVGTCSQNYVTGTWADKNLPIFKRLQKVFQVKNFPIVPWTIFTIRHSGFFWFLYWFLPYIRAVIGYKDLSKSSSFCEDNHV